MFILALSNFILSCSFSPCLFLLLLQYNKRSAGYPANVYTYTYIHQFPVYFKLSSLLGCVEVTVNIYSLLDFHCIYHKLKLLYNAKLHQRFKFQKVSQFLLLCYKAQQTANRGNIQTQRRFQKVGLIMLSAKIPNVLFQLQSESKLLSDVWWWDFFGALFLIRELLKMTISSCPYIAALGEAKKRTVMGKYKKQLVSQLMQCRAIRAAAGCLE